MQDLKTTQALNFWAAAAVNEDLCSMDQARYRGTITVARLTDKSCARQGETYIIGSEHDRLIDGYYENAWSGPGKIPSSERSPLQMEKKNPLLFPTAAKKFLHV